VEIGVGVIVVAILVGIVMAWTLSVRRQMKVVVQNPVITKCIKGSINVNDKTLKISVKELKNRVDFGS
jgi:hypothetical protein